jgi:hypothetical protein
MFGRFRTTNVEVLLRFESQTFDFDGFASFFLTPDRVYWWTLWVLSVNHNTEGRNIQRSEALNSISIRREGVVVVSTYLGHNEGSRCGRRREFSMRASL